MDNVLFKTPYGISKKDKHQKAQSTIVSPLNSTNQSLNNEGFKE